jgi:hypothetical protein
MGKGFSAMNRAQRRQADRNARRNITHTERIVPLPALLDEFTVFDMPQSIIEQLKNGAIDTAEDVPVFRDNTGQWCEIAPALAGWVFTWQKISDELKLSLPLKSFHAIAESLEKGRLIQAEIVGIADIALDICRIAFRTADRKEIVRIAKNAQLQILLNPTIN